MADQAALEQFAVAGQHDAALAGGQLGDLLVVEMVVVERVEADHAQQVGEAAEVGIGDEAHDPQRFFPHLEQRADIQALELGVNRHPVAILQQSLEAHRLAVDQQ
ncbi:hypothetical protein D9M68_920950 [compost metagenome]